jgi:hypothetical protein
MSSPNATGTVRDPLHEGAPEAATPPSEAASAEPAPIRVQGEAVVGASAAPAPAPAPAAAPAAQPQAQPQPEAEPSEFWKRLHLVVGGHYNLESVKVAGEAEPFHSAAAEHRGWGLSLQPTYSLVRSPSFDFNLGLNFSQTWFYVPKKPGSVESDIGATTIAALAEGNVFFHEHFGLGLNGYLGYMGLSSSNADVGAPYSASLDFDGNLTLGGQAYLHAWRGAFRLGAGFSGMPGGFGLTTSPGNPDLLVSMGTPLSLFLGADVLQIVRNAQGKAGERPK